MSLEREKEELEQIKMEIEELNQIDNFMDQAYDFLNSSNPNYYYSKMKGFQLPFGTKDLGKLQVTVPGSV